MGLKGQAEGCERGREGAADANGFGMRSQRARPMPMTKAMPMSGLGMAGVATESIKDTVKRLS